MAGTLKGEDEGICVCDCLVPDKGMVSMLPLVMLVSHVSHVSHVLHKYV